MDQKKIGQFIAALRKNKNMKQNISVKQERIQNEN